VRQADGFPQGVGRVRLVPQGATGETGQLTPVAICEDREELAARAEVFGKAGSG